MGMVVSMGIAAAAAAVVVATLASVLTFAHSIAVRALMYPLCCTSSTPLGSV